MEVFEKMVLLYILNSQNLEFLYYIKFFINHLYDRKEHNYVNYRCLCSCLHNVFNISILRPSYLKIKKLLSSMKYEFISNITVRYGTIINIQIFQNLYNILRANCISKIIEQENRR